MKFLKYFVFVSLLQIFSMFWGFVILTFKSVPLSAIIDVAATMTLLYVMVGTPGLVLMAALSALYLTQKKYDQQVKLELVREQNNRPK